jgi:hypothetical protein
MMTGDTSSMDEIIEVVSKHPKIMAMNIAGILARLEAIDANIVNMKTRGESNAERLEDFEYGLSEVIRIIRSMEERFNSTILDLKNRIVELESR